MRISQQLRSAAIGILVVGSSSLVSVYLNYQGNDSKVVNYAGIVRGGTQRLIKLELAQRPNDPLIEKQDKLVNGLINGDRVLGLPAATDPEFKSQIEKVATAWQDLKQKIVVFRQNSKTKADLLDASEKYFELADKAVFAAEKHATDKAERLRIIQIAVFAASLLLLLKIWMTVTQITNILKKSTNDITQSSNRIASVVVEQEKCINQQALSVSKTTQLMSGLKELAQESNNTGKISNDRVKQILELLSKSTQESRKNSTDLSSLQEKIQTIQNHLEMLEKQVLKIAKVATRSEQSVLQNGTVARQSSLRNNTNNRTINSESIDTLLDNLQSSISVMKLVANDSMNLLDIEVKPFQEKIIADLDRVLAMLDYLSLSNQQTFTISNQCMSAVKQVMMLMEGLNVGAQGTASSISQIALSAGQLGETTAALQTKI